jgi:hypothetical protein
MGPPLGRKTWGQAIKVVIRFAYGFANDDSRKTLIVVIIVVARHIFQMPLLASKMLIASKIKRKPLLNTTSGVRYTWNATTKCSP